MKNLLVFFIIYVIFYLFILKKFPADSLFLPLKAG